MDRYQWFLLGCLALVVMGLIAGCADMAGHTCGHFGKVICNG